MPERRVVRRAPQEEPDDDDFNPADDEDDDDARPARGVKSMAGKAKPPARGAKPSSGKPPAAKTGWSGAHRTKEASSDFADELKLDDEHVLIKFLEDEPLVSYRQHWVERDGKKSFTCLEDDCPLCDIGDRPAGKYAFNVLLLSDGEPVNKLWIVGTRLVNTLEAYAEDTKTGPLTKHYWSVNRTGNKGKKSGGNVQTNLQMVKERDLQEDWEIEPLEDDILDLYRKKSFDIDSAVQYQTRKQLRDIAKELSDDVDDED